MGRVWTTMTRSVWALACVGLLACQAAAQDGAGGGPDETRILLLQSKPRAYSIVEAAIRHEQPRVRLAALEAAQHAPDAAFDMARAGLSDDNPAVRFGALVAVGKLKMDRLADAALDLMRDENESVRAAAMFAASRCGKDINLSPLASMLASGRPSSRANAAMLIGQLGDPQAIEMLRDMADRPMRRVSSAERTWVRLQFAEAMIRLDPDDGEALASIRAAMYSPLDDVRVLSMQILGEVGDQAVRGGLTHIMGKDNPIQVRVAAAQALVRMGDRRGVSMLMEASTYDERQLRKDLGRFIEKNDIRGPEAQAIRDLLSDDKQRVRAAAEVRAQATVALGWVGTKAAAGRLADLLDDPDPIVQVAAASAVLRASR